MDESTSGAFVRRRFSGKEGTVVCRLPCAPGRRFFTVLAFSMGLNWVKLALFQVSSGLAVPHTSALKD